MTLILCIPKDDVTTVKQVIDEDASFSLDEIFQILWIDNALACGEGDLWFKDISIFSSGSHVVQPSWTFWSILVERIMRTTSVKLFWFWTSGSDFIWRYIYLDLSWPLY